MAVSRRWRRRLLWAAGLVVAYAALGYLLLPFIARRQLEARLPELLQREVKLAELAFDPFRFTVRLAGLEIRERSGAPFFSLEELFVDATPSALLLGDIRVAELRLVAPRFAFALERGGRLSFADLLVSSGTPAPPPAEPARPPRVLLDSFSLSRGSVHFTDRSRAQVFVTEISPLELSLTGFSTAPATNSPYQVSARIDPGTTLEWSGELSLDPLRSAGRFRLRGVELGSARPYLAELVRLTLTRGTLDVQASYSFDASRGAPQLVVTDGALLLRGLSLKGGEAPLLELPRLTVGGVELDLGARRVGVRAVALEGAALALAREKDGQLDLLRWLAPPPARTSSAVPPRTETSTGSPWQVALGEVRLSSAAVTFRDLAPARPAEVRVSAISAEVRSLRLPFAEPWPLKVALTVADRGRLHLEGTYAPAGGQVALQYTLTELPLALAQPWLAESLQLELAQGALSARGSLALHPRRALSVEGGLELAGLLVKDAGGAELAGLERLALERLVLTLPLVDPPAPLELGLGAARLAGARVRVVQLGPGRTNLQQLTRAAPPGPRPPPAAPAPDPQIRVERVQLERVVVDFADRSLPTPFSTKLQLGGTLGPYQSPAPARTRLDLKGRLDFAPLTLSGAVRPRGKASEVELALALNGWDLLATTPYAVKYAGYPVEKGKLTLELGYQLADKKLAGKNHVLIDQLTLGVDRVDGPDATGLPVKLALAVLTDRHGKIDLDLPVSGDLDDPEFSFGGIIVKTLLNLLEKVATSPFALIGALVGGGDELSAVAFVPGESTLAPPEQEKLAKIAQALTDRPALRLSISGALDPGADARALGLRAIRAELGGAPSGATPEQGLRQLYQRVVGRPPGALSVPELESELLAKRPVEAEALRALAQARAAAVQERLHAAHQIAPERLFQAAPKLELGRSEAVLGLE